MKSAFIAVIFSAVVASTVSAQCACDPADNACLSSCVNNTNKCITDCASNNDCYQSCITSHWPGADPRNSAVEMATSSYATASSTAWSSSMEATPSSQWSSGWPSSWAASATQQSSMWGSQSSAWPSSSASWASPSGSWAPGYTNSMATPAASGTPNANGASVAQISKAVLGLGLACAAYALQ